MDGASNRNLGHDVTYRSDDPEEEDLSFHQLPMYLRDFLLYDAVAPISSVEMTEAYWKFFPDLSWQDIYTQVKAASRTIHIAGYGGKRPEDG